MPKNCGTDFRNFHFKIFAEFFLNFKSAGWELYRSLLVVRKFHDDSCNLLTNKHSLQAQSMKNNTSPRWLRRGNEISNWLLVATDASLDQ